MIQKQSSTFRFKINVGVGGYFFGIFGDPRSLFWPPPFINLSNFSKNYTEVHKYIIDSWCFIGVSRAPQYTRSPDVERT